MAQVPVHLPLVYLVPVEYAVDDGGGYLVIPAPLKLHSEKADLCLLLLCPAMVLNETDELQVYERDGHLSSLCVCQVPNSQLPRVLVRSIVGDHGVLDDVLGHSLLVLVRLT